MTSSASSDSIELKFGGEKISLRQTAGDSEFARQVTKLVTERLDAASVRVRKTAPAHQIALLALMDLAAEYLEAKRRTEAYMAEVQAQTSRILKKGDHA